MKRSMLVMPVVVAVAVGATVMVMHAQNTAPATNATTKAMALAPYKAQAKERLDKSPRHFDYVDIKVPGSDAPMKTFVVHPERSDKAPVVIVIMEIYGLSDWLKGTCDQLAADGFIAIGPDLISGKGPNGGGTESFTSRSDVTAQVQGLNAGFVISALDAARAYGLKLPSANGKSATVGFCWGGTKSFAYAATQPELNAAVVFYGSGPADAELEKIKCPVAGFYGGNDPRVTNTVAGTTASMKRLEKKYEPHVYDGAGHGFMRAHAPSDSAPNQKAAEQAWPAVVQFLKDSTK